MGLARSRQATRPGEGGFTLIEMVVASVILAVGIAGAVATFGAISRATGAAAEYDRAALLAERRLAEVQALGAGQATSESGDFEEPDQAYHWEQEVLDTETENLVELRLTVSWESGTSRRSVVISTYLLQEPEESA